MGLSAPGWLHNPTITLAHLETQVCGGQIFCPQTSRNLRVHMTLITHIYQHCVPDPVLHVVHVFATTLRGIAAAVILL